MAEESKGKKRWFSLSTFLSMVAALVVGSLLDRFIVSKAAGHLENLMFGENADADKE